MKRPKKRRAKLVLDRVRLRRARLSADNFADAEFQSIDMNGRPLRIGDVIWDEAATVSGYVVAIVFNRLIYIARDTREKKDIWRGQAQAAKCVEVQIESDVLVLDEDCHELRFAGRRDRVKYLRNKREAEERAK